ncbi:MAG: hypothetical protein Unbinned3459contig1000_83 [Prokaryotic dsDNA virus sp.]|jgi:hypothetical protein|nr:MAG: hypothetical protein Unbinned3459contig1000_83 [Prokaryotic dsDNA virus sp.]|tara:strand:+ start:72964 stop:75222 length:2259 start_codon:yes stop_codon:yes gene_type:complete
MSGTLRLRGATSGYSELQAPAVAADQTFVLPSTGGTLLTTDSPVPKLTLQLGSASQPSLTFQGDTDTGLFSAGANTLNLVTGGSNRLVIDSSGRVGVGTSSPGTKLQVNGDVKVVNTGITYLQPNTVSAFQTYESSGPVKIELLNNGSINAAGDLFKLYSNGSIDLYRQTTTGTNGLLTFHSDLGGTRTQKAIIKADGSAEFAGPITIYDALAVAASDSSFIIRNPGNTADVATIDGAGSAEFAADAKINTLTVGLGASGVTNNTALGYNALAANVNGGGNLALGYAALAQNTSGGNNTAAGYGALNSNSSGANNVAIGLAALERNTSASNNTAVGLSSLANNTTGANNTAVGYYAGYTNTTGTLNTFIGRSAAAFNTTGTQNTALGYQALYTNSTGGNNVAIGLHALYSSTTVNANVAIGTNCMKSATTAIYNTAIGYKALESITTSSYHTAVGYEALLNNGSGQINTVVGFHAMRANTSGSFNTGLGYAALVSNHTGQRNTAVGYQALNDNTSGSYNTAVGMYSHYYATTGDGNTALGYTSLHNCTTSNYNTAIGYQALYQTTTGSQNTAIGLSAGYAVTTGSCNTLIGRSALEGLTTGSGNIGLGNTDAGGSYNPTFYVTTESNRLVLGHNGITNAYVKVSWTVTSDERDKMNFASVPHGLDFVNQLKPTAFQFKVDRDTEEPSGDVRYGFKAQDILALEGDNPVIIDAEDPDHLKYKGEHLVPVLVNAVQELTKMVKELQTEIESLKG